MPFSSPTKDVASASVNSIPKLEAISFTWFAFGVSIGMGFSS
jgi:hypothetical protein